MIPTTTSTPPNVGFLHQFYTQSASSTLHIYPHHLNKPKSHIIEKCQELDIDIFYCYEGYKNKVTELDEICRKLDQLIKKSSI